MNEVFATIVLGELYPMYIELIDLVNVLWTQIFLED